MTYPIKRLTKSEQEERNRKISKMIQLGCSYADIGRRYGITPRTIHSLIRRGQVEQGTKDCFGSAGDFGRACYVDGIDG